MTAAVPLFLFVYLLFTVNYKNPDNPVLNQIWLARSKAIFYYIVVVSMLLQFGIDIFPFIDTEEAKEIRRYNLSNCVCLMAIYCINKFKNFVPKKDI